MKVEGAKQLLIATALSPLLLAHFARSVRTPYDSLTCMSGCEGQAGLPLRTLIIHADGAQTMDWPGALGGLLIIAGALWLVLMALDLLQRNISSRLAFYMASFVLLLGVLAVSIAVHEPRHASAELQKIAEAGHAEYRSQAPAYWLSSMRARHWVVDDIRPIGEDDSVVFVCFRGYDGPFVTRRLQWGWYILVGEKDELRLGGYGSSDGSIPAEIWAGSILNCRSAMK